MGEITSWAIMLGDPTVGFVLVGPFYDVEDANDHAEAEYANDTWWVFGLVSPEPAIQDTELPHE